MSCPSDAFASLLQAHQATLFRFIVSVLGNHESAADVLQETNRMLLEKQSDFELGTEFDRWAVTVAKYQTMAWVRDRGRDRHLLTPEIAELLVDAAEAEVLDGEASDRAAQQAAQQTALKTCIEKLSPDQQALVQSRYFQGLSIKQIAAGESENTIKQRLFRVRNKLARCIQSQLSSPPGRF